MRKIVFWLEYPLFHVAPLIKSLSIRETVEVVVVTEFDIPLWRKDMGFPEPDFGKALLYKSPTKASREALMGRYSSSDSFHVFHGLRHVKENFLCFKRLVKTEAVIGLYFEPVKLLGGFKSLVKEAYYRLLFFRYSSRLNFMLALGDIGVDQFTRLGIPGNKIYSFEYHFDPDLEGLVSKGRGEVVDFLYAGRLVDIKNVGLTIRAFALLYNKGVRNFSFKIVGDGERKKELLSMIVEANLENHVFLYDGVSSDELKKYYFDADAFILSSKFEGWGAVATESISYGLALIVSDGCASSSVVKEDYLGRVFKNNCVGSLSIAISSILKDRSMLSIEERKKRISYANDFLSGRAGGDKLTNIFDSILVY